MIFVGVLNGHLCGLSDELYSAYQTMNIRGQAEQKLEVGLAQDSEISPLAMERSYSVVGNALKSIVPSSAKLLKGCPAGTRNEGIGGKGNWLRELRRRRRNDWCLYAHGLILCSSGR